MSESYLQRRRYPQVKLEPEVIRALAGRLSPGAVLAESELLSAGYMNTTYRLRMADGSRCALKIYSRDSSFAGNEVKSLEALSGSGLPVPKVLLADFSRQTSPNPVCIFSWIGDGGVSLNDALADSSLDEAKGLGKLLGRVLAKLHSTNADISDDKGVDELIAGYVRDGNLRRYFEPEEISLLSESARWFAEKIRALPKVLVHGDFRDANLMLRKSGGAWELVGFIDFETAHRGPAIKDIATLLYYEDSLPSSFLPALLEEYRTNGGEIPSDWKVLADGIVLERGLEILAHPADRGSVTRLFVDKVRKILKSYSENSKAKR